MRSADAAPAAAARAVRGRRRAGWRRLLWWAPACAVAVGIFFLSSRPKLPKPEFQIPGLDKFAHAGVYAALAAAVYLALRRTHGMAERRAVILATVLAAAYGVTDEIHQIFVPLRSAELADWMADGAGALAGALAGAVASRHAARPAAHTRTPSQ